MACHPRTIDSRQVTRVKYSPSGHLLAVLEGREVIIYSTMQYEHLAVLRGHYHTVDDCAWSSDSLYLATVAAEAVYVWIMDGYRRYVGMC